MISQKTIGQSAWTAITTAGQQASVWMDEEGNGKRGKADCRITHSDSGVPADALITAGKKIYKSNGNNDMMILAPDNSSDIFYARCVNVGDQVLLTVDAV